MDARIKDTYARKSRANYINSLYDSYIRAFRWASDRIDESGVVAFVTNAGFIRSEAAAGVRAYLHEEFTDVWCFDLRGNGRITGDGRNIFEYPGQNSGGTRTPVAIIILVKNPAKTEHVIRYYALGSKYYSGDEKRKRVRELGSIQGIDSWQTITPDKNHDWVEQRDDAFTNYLPMGNKEAKSGEVNTIFKTFSLGVSTNRDAWVYNSSKNEL